MSEQQNLIRIISELETQIMSLVYEQTQCFCKFNYSSENEKKYVLRLETVNPKHIGTSFILETFEAINKKKCLEKCMHHLKVTIPSKHINLYEVV
jgi:hypothetical protein